MDPLDNGSIPRSTARFTLASSSFFLVFSRSALARAARRDLECALAAHEWPWSPRLSAWLDCLRVLEEGNV